MTKNDNFLRKAPFWQLANLSFCLSFSCRFPEGLSFFVILWFVILCSVMCHPEQEELDKLAQLLRTRSHHCCFIICWAWWRGESDARDRMTPVRFSWKATFGKISLTTSVTIPTCRPRFWSRSSFNNLRDKNRELAITKICNHQKPQNIKITKS
jgi:hypothetical protein